MSQIHEPTVTHVAWVADTLIANLTVEEMLRYTIELKVESSVPMSQKLEKVDSVIQQLNLEQCRGVRIGNVERRGISGEIITGTLYAFHVALHMEKKQ